MHAGMFTSALGFAILCVGCAGARSLAEAPAKPVNLSGEWRLNAALSDDARRILEEAQSRVREQFKRRQEEYRRSEQLDRDPQGDYETRALERGPYRDFGPAVEIPAQITLSQNGGDLTIMSDDSETRFQAGRQSVVSFGQGVADRRVGWSGQTFIVSTRAVDGQARGAVLARQGRASERDPADGRGRPAEGGDQARLRSRRNLTLR